MALTQGTVTIANDGSIDTGTGISLTYYNDLLAEFGGDIPSGPEGAPFKKNLAAAARAKAATLFSEMTNNAKARVTTGDGGLQQTPNPNNPATDTDPPTGNKDLAIV